MNAEIWTWTCLLYTSLNADDRHFINTLLGEGEVSVRIQQADDSESEIQEAIFCGLWRVSRRHGEQLLEDKLAAGCAPLALWQAATQNVLPTDSLLPPPIDGLMNGLPSVSYTHLVAACL